MDELRASAYQVYKLLQSRLKNGEPSLEDAIMLELLAPHFELPHSVLGVRFTDTAYAAPFIVYSVDGRWADAICVNNSKLCVTRAISDIREELRNAG